jgi:hypothetical protein
MSQSSTFLGRNPYDEGTADRFDPERRRFSAWA